MKKYGNLFFIAIVIIINAVFLRIVYRNAIQKSERDITDVSQAESKQMIHDFVINKDYLNLKTSAINYNTNPDEFIPDILPIEANSYISQKYKENHKGVDFVAEKNSVINSTAAGFVEKVVEDKYFGKTIVINHLNGDLTLYGHLSKFLVSEKDFVQKGEVIGVIGNTGNSSSTHLHYGIIKNKEFVNPEKFIRGEYEKK